MSILDANESFGLPFPVGERYILSRLFFLNCLMKIIETHLLSIAVAYCKILDLLKAKVKDRNTGKPDMKGVWRNIAMAIYPHRESSLAHTLSKIIVCTVCSFQFFSEVDKKAVPVADHELGTV